MDQTRLKCYADMAQQKRYNNKYYISTFWYHIDCDE